MEVASLPKMMKPDIGGEAMSKHSPDLPGWLGTARRNRSVEEPGRPGGQRGSGVTPVEQRGLTGSIAAVKGKESRLEEIPATEQWLHIEALNKQVSGRRAAGSVPS